MMIDYSSSSSSGLPTSLVPAARFKVAAFASIMSTLINAYKRLKNHNSSILTCFKNPSYGLFSNSVRFGYVFARFVLLFI